MAVGLFLLKPTSSRPSGFCPLPWQHSVHWVSVLKVLIFSTNASQCSMSCTYFENFSTFLHWVMFFESGQNAVVHYLDDFLFVGPANSDLCSCF